MHISPTVSPPTWLLRSHIIIFSLPPTKTPCQHHPKRRTPRPHFYAVHAKANPLRHLTNQDTQTMTARPYTTPPCQACIVNPYLRFQKPQPTIHCITPSHPCPNTHSSLSQARTAVPNQPKPSRAPHPHHNTMFQPTPHSSCQAAIAVALRNAPDNIRPHTVNTAAIL